LCNAGSLFLYLGRRMSMEIFICIIFSLLIGFSAGYQKKRKKLEKRIAELENQREYSEGSE